MGHLAKQREMPHFFVYFSTRTVMVCLHHNGSSYLDEYRISIFVFRHLLKVVVYFFNNL